MNIHSGHIRLAISLYHTQKFPSVSLVKPRVICNQIDRRNPIEFQICYDHIQQMSGNALTAVVFFGVYGADVRC